MVYRRRGKGIKPGREAVQRLTALLLCLVTLIPIFTIGIGAIREPYEVPETPDVPEGKQMKDTYILAVSTGFVPGDTVEYFSIRYVDGKGITRSEFIFPHDNSNIRGYEEAAKVSTQDERRKNVLKNTGYSTMPSYQTGNALKKDSLDMYMIEMPFGFSELIDIEIFMRYASYETEKIKNEWTCNDIRFYRVDTLYGEKMAGYYSSDYYIDFDGEMIAQFDNTQYNSSDFSTANEGKIFRLGQDKNKPYGLKTKNNPDPAKRIPEDLLKYSTGDSERDFLFRFDLSDMHGAGIEALANEYAHNKALLREMDLCEALVLHIAYQDVYGITRNVDLPVITSFAAWAAEKCSALETDAVIGIAQQGDTIMFEGTIPDFAKFTEYTLVFTDKAEENARISSTDTERRTQRKAKLAGEKIYYTGISIFDPQTARYEVYLDEAVLRARTSGNPLWYFRSKSVNGHSIDIGGKKNMVDSLGPVAEDQTDAVTLLPKVSESAYLFELSTDSVPSAGTEKDIYVRLHYKSTKGEDKITDDMALRELVRDYYGYWPSSGGDIAYLAGAEEGGKLIFTVNYNDVDYFTAIDLWINFENREDEDIWQMSSLSVYRVNSVSQRYAEWLDSDRQFGNCMTDRRIYREYSKDDRTQYTTKKALLTYETPKITISFDGKGGSSTEIDDVNWEQIKESMTYNEARQDLGFTKGRYMYRVNVEVCSNSSASELYGDCGSNNKFYFQLIFENGTTAYVQANQQLEADGFRAGHTEGFTIVANRNYGDVKAIRIIPDDTSEDAELIYDKLNIKQIEIVQQDTGGLSRTWLIENVGWISIDYQDSGAKSTIQGQKLRSEFEIAQNCVIDKKGYSINFLVTVMTGGYPEGMPQYDGCLTAVISYIDSSGAKRETEAIDVAQAMGKYYGVPTYLMDPSGSDTKTGVPNRHRVNTKYMLRPGSIDRFVVSIFDVTEILSIKFNVECSKQTVWEIDEVNIYQIITNGNRILNSNGEFQRDGEIQLLCKDSQQEPYNVEILYNDFTSSIDIDFEDNEIQINSDAWETVIERVPSSSDDYMNIYIYPTADADLANAEGLKAALIYHKRDIDKSYQVSVDELRISEEKHMIYVNGVGTSGITRFDELHLKSRDQLKIDYAVVQRVRAGVVIATYYVDFNTLDAQYYIISVPTSHTNYETGEQKIAMQFSANTQPVTLIPNTLDIAVNIGYTTVNDLGNTVYDSAFVYLTDQGITQINPGDIVELSFKESYVKEIRQINIVSLGEVAATLDGVSITTYSRFGSVSKLTGQYSIGVPVPITRTKRIIECTNANCVPFDIELATDSDESYAGMQNNQVTMRIGVVDQDGQNSIIVIDDAARFLVTEDYVPGGILWYRMMLSNVETIQSLTVEAYKRNSGDPADFPLTNVSAEWMIGGESRVVSRKTDMEQTEKSAYTVNLSDISIKAIVRSSREDEGIIVNRTIRDGNFDFEIESGDTVDILPSVDNSLPNYGTTVTLTRDSDGKEFAFTKDLKDEKRLVFRPENNENKENETYTIVIASEEAPTVSMKITFGVRQYIPEETTEEETEAPEEEPEKPDVEDPEETE